MCPQIVLICHPAYKEGMHKNTIQSESFVNANANIRLQIFNRSNARIIFQKLV